MIILLEPVCYGWVHEEVNAGMLKLIDQCASEEIVYIGERKQVECIRNLYISNKISFCVYNQLIENGEPDSYSNTIYYIRLLCACIKKYHPSNLFVLSAYRPCILAAIAVAYLYPKTSIKVVLHGMVEGNKGKSDSYKRLFRISERNKNLMYITYSPFCTDSYWDLHKEKMHFINHPYIPAQLNGTKKVSCHDKVIIGIIGACANQKAKRLIAKINGMMKNGDYEFWIASRFANKFRNMEHVKIIDLAFDRKEMESQMQEMDCLVLIYDKNEYTVSASGVLWDAVSNQIPCFMLDSPYLGYYEKYIRGILLEDVDELAVKIAHFIKTQDEEKMGSYKIIALNEHNQKQIIKLIK